MATITSAFGASYRQAALETVERLMGVHPYILEEYSDDSGESSPSGYASEPGGTGSDVQIRNMMELHERASNTSKAGTPPPKKKTGGGEGVDPDTDEDTDTDSSDDTNTEDSFVWSGEWL